jgi:hypothetical protein
MELKQSSFVAFSAKNIQRVLVCFLQKTEDRESINQATYTHQLHWIIKSELIYNRRNKVL